MTEPAAPAAPTAPTAPSATAPADLAGRLEARLVALIPDPLRFPGGRQIDWRGPIGLLVAAVAGSVFFASAGFDAGRPDLFYLADAFWHGRTWLSYPLGPDDVIPLLGRYYVPFPPFPAIMFMPLMLLISPETAHAYEPLINSTLAAIDIGLVWMLAARIGVDRKLDRLWLALLLGFSTAIWWVTVRGGVWHTGHLVATMLTLAALIEAFGRRRPLLIGLLIGAAFLTRPPVIFGLFFFAIVLTLDRSIRTPQGRRSIARDWLLLAVGVAPSIAFYFWYNDVRFGSPLESGYQLATLPAWLASLRDQGLFSLSHLARNWDYFMLDLPKQISGFPWFRPDGLGMSILVTSPGLLMAFRANWRNRLSWALAIAFVLVMVPNLLYYGGGWLQYGFRYALDAIPFAIALCAIALTRNRAGLIWWLVLAFGLLVGAGGVYWAYNI